MRFLDEKMYTSEEVAELLNCKPQMVRLRARRGDFPTYKLGSHPRSRSRFLGADLNRWLYQGKPILKNLN